MKKTLTILSIFAIFFLSYTITKADDAFVFPIDTTLEIENSSIAKGETVKAILTINNNSPFEVSAKIAVRNNNVISVKDPKQISVSVPPYGSYNESFEVSGSKIGVTKLMLVATYNWTNNINKQKYQRTEVVNSGQVDVTGFKFDWPNYIIPLLIGFSLSQLGSWITEWRKQKEEDFEKQEQALNLTLVMLNIAQKGIERHEPISFRIWEDVILKDNLYTHLAKLSNKVKEPDLTKKIANLSVLISEYNNRQKESTLTEDFIIDLSEELQSLIGKLK